MSEPLPPRSSALPARMLLAFDLDCGPLVQGHRFIARGLADDGLVPIPEHLREEEAGGDEDSRIPPEQGWDITWVPRGVPDSQLSPAQLRARREMDARREREERAPTWPCFSFEYEIVPGVPPAKSGGSFFDYLVGIHYDADTDLAWEPTDSGAIASFSGGPSTHGSRGSWPLPARPGVLRFTLYGVQPGSHWPDEHPSGTVIVDVAAGTAAWEPTAHSTSS